MCCAAFIPWHPHGHAGLQNAADGARAEECSTATWTSWVVNANCRRAYDRYALMQASHQILRGGMLSDAVPKVVMRRSLDRHHGLSKGITACPMTGSMTRDRLAVAPDFVQSFSAPWRECSRTCAPLAVAAAAKLQARRASGTRPERVRWGDEAAAIACLPAYRADTLLAASPPPGPSSRCRRALFNRSEPKPSECQCREP